MNYRELFDTAMKLISSPAKAWEEISMEEDRRKVLIAFVYPMIALCGCAVFLGALFENGWGGPLGFQIAMTQCCATAVALFGGYFLAAYVINEMGVRMGLDSNLPLIQQFAGYSLVVPFLLQMVTGILPDFKIIAWLLQFYTVFVVWEGVPILLKPLEESLRLKYTLLMSLLLIVCPAVIQMVFVKLTVAFN